MHTLWSRAIQTRYTCRCASCISNTTALARRATIVAGRRLGRPGPSSTLLYSTIFATAAIVDGRAKRNRRDQWDAAISSAKESVNPAKDSVEWTSTVEGDVEGTDAWFPESWKAPWLDGSDIKLVNRTVGMEVINDGIIDLEQRSGNDLEGDIEDLWELLAGGTRMDWPLNTGAKLILHHLPPQSLWAPDHIRAKALRRRRCAWKKMRRIEMSVAKLVYGLLERIKLYGQSEVAVNALPVSVQSVAALEPEEFHISANDISLCLASVIQTPIDLVDKVHSPNVVRPTYSQDVHGEFHAICDEMNNALQSIFRHRPTEPERAKVLVAKICHNLLVSPAPPDIQTYNILITGFARLEQPDLCSVVIDSLLETKIRPNEITCAAILDFYTRTNQPTEFSNFVALMRGINQGLMLAKPDIWINNAGKSRLVHLSNGKTVQRVHQSPLIFDVLMHGVLRFAGCDRAMEIYHEMKSDGWGLGSKGLMMFLEDCAKQNDWANGCLVWEEIQMLKDKTNTMGKRETKSHRSWEHRAYNTMLDLCRNTSHSIAFTEILNEAVACGHDRKTVVKALNRRYLTSQENDQFANTNTASEARNIGVLLADAVQAYFTDASSQSLPDLENRNLREIDENCATE
ncbi:uncharacterized protein K441DRAFT_655503 [Cenococcum geophilum 1.58]|uniref:uncharacterized protein n=1 Tax=Cenococcum geophilum 1.58 TaxID=794803 RepID=UPI00358EB90D|nr:hypothetical protein K441DRAFT_655503 [Cenococcum geophilum 1.58]